jgi:hypothetical protein
MSMRTNFPAPAAVIASFLFVGLLPGISLASTVLVTSRASLAGNDAIDWGSLGPIPTKTLFDGPFTIASVGGNNVEVSNQNSNRFEWGVQSTDFTANFSTGANLLNSNEVDVNASNGAPSRSTPVSLKFPGQPVMGVGANVANSGSTAASQITIEAFDAADQSLGSFALTDSGYGSTAFFIGILSDTSDIARVEFDVSTNQGGKYQGFFLNQVDLVTTPVPAALPLFLSALAGLGFAGRRRRAGRRI